MAKDFIKITDMRIRFSTIKRYKPFNDDRLYVYYTTSRSKIEWETFYFDSRKERDEMVTELDSIFL